MEPTKKNDAGKPRFSLIPWDCLEEVAQVFTEGAKVHGDSNWRNDIGTSRHHQMRRRFLDAVLRHLTAVFTDPMSDYTQEESLDKDSGLHHWAHAIANLMFLYTYDTHNQNTGLKKHRVSEEKKSCKLGDVAWEEGSTLGTIDVTMEDAFKSLERIKEKMKLASRR